MWQFVHWLDWWDRVSPQCLNWIDWFIPLWQWCWWARTVYPKKYAHGFCFAVLCCGYTLTDFPISIRLTSLALWQSNDCPSASKATLMHMDKYFMWIHCERLHNHNKAKHNKTVCIFLGIYCVCDKSNMGCQFLVHYPGKKDIHVFCAQNKPQKASECDRNCISYLFRTIAL